MTPTTPEEREWLKEIASKATPGPWYGSGPLSEEESCRAGGIECDIVVESSEPDEPAASILEELNEKDQAHIAAFDPPTALRLIADVERLEKIVEWLPKTADGALIVPGMALFSGSQWKAEMIAYLDDDPKYPFEQCDPKHLYSTREAALAHKDTTNA